MLYLAAIAYAIVFWALTWSRPQVALLLIFALAPFQNDLSAGGPFRFSIAEVNLFLSLPVFIAQCRPWKLTPLAGAIGSYIAVCLLSSILHWRDTAPISLLQISLYLVIAVVVFRSLPRRNSEYRPAFYALVIICACIAVAVLIARSGYVLGLHKNGTGGSLACGLIVCTELWFSERNAVRKPWLLGTLTVIAAGLLFTLSRGAWLTAVTGITVILALRKEFRTMLRAGVLFTALVVVCWGKLSADSRTYATALDRENFNIRARYESMDIAMDEFRNAPILGAGVGLRKQFDATNIVFLTLAETGVVGLITLLAVHFIFLRCMLRTVRRMPRILPDFCIVAIATAMVFGKITHGMVDHYWGRGDLMMTWAAAGMALRVYDSRRRAPSRPCKVLVEKL
jgi:hypothetical protein